MEGVKTCTRCGDTKPRDQFYDDSRYKDGKNSHCKTCKNRAWQAWRDANFKPRRQAEAAQRREQRAAERAATHDARVEAKRARKREAQARYRRANPDAFRDWVAKNRPRYNSLKRQQKVGRAKATPVWADAFLIEEHYHLAQLRTEATGIAWHVDHIVPLRGANVSGLHVEHNLQVIPAQMNLAKGNRQWPS